MTPFLGNVQTGLYRDKDQWVVRVGGMGGQDKRLIAREYSSLFQVDEKIIKMMWVRSAQLCEYTKTHMYGIWIFQ